MRGLYSSKTKIRHAIFTEIARMAYEGNDTSTLEELPYRIVPGEVALYRDDIFLERAVVGERLRVAMGMSLRSITEHAPVSKGVEASVIEEKYYEPPLINVIKFACNACAEKRVFVTEGCQGCLEHPCREVCPKGAITMINGKSKIDESKCIKCGKCIEACPYNAIIKQERPCSQACGMGAIHSDEHGRAEIDQDKCVSCGMCLVSCPFSAIVDKGQIYQTVLALKSETPVYAIVAPAIAGQFEGLKNTQIRSAFQALGFTDIREVAVGADLCTIEEAKDFLKEVPEKLPFMATSCCPAWSMMAKKLFPQQAECISMALTPMVLTARLIKQKEPDCKIVFVGPCAAKKLEASRRTIRSYVDFVLTFEEVAGMFEAKNIDFSSLPEGEPLVRASADGRGFAASCSHTLLLQISQAPGSTAPLFPCRCSMPSGNIPGSKSRPPVRESGHIFSPSCRMPLHLPQVPSGKCRTFPAVLRPQNQDASAHRTEDCGSSHRRSYRWSHRSPLPLPAERSMTGSCGQCRG